MLVKSLIYKGFKYELEGVGNMDVCGIYDVYLDICAMKKKICLMDDSQ